MWRLHLATKIGCIQGPGDWAQAWGFKGWEYYFHFVPRIGIQG